jgi:hypothetical protein
LAHSLGRSSTSSQASETSRRGSWTTCNLTRLRGPASQESDTSSNWWRFLLFEQSPQPSKSRVWTRSRTQLTLGSLMGAPCGAGSGAGSGRLLRGIGRRRHSSMHGTFLYSMPRVDAGLCFSYSHPVFPAGFQFTALVSLPTLRFLKLDTRVGTGVGTGTVASAVAGTVADTNTDTDADTGAGRHVVIAGHFRPLCGVSPHYFRGGMRGTF